MKKIIFIIISLAVTAGVVFLISSRGGYVAPEEKIASSFNNTMQLETFSSSVSLEMEGRVDPDFFFPEISQGFVSLNVNTLVDNTNADISGNADFSFGADGITMSGTASFIFSDNKFFGRLDSPLPGVYQGYVDQWFLLFSGEDIDLDNFGIEQITAIYENIIKEEAIKIKYEGKERVDQVNASKYRIDLDTDNLLRAIQRYIEEMDVDEDIKAEMIEELEYFDEYNPFDNIDVFIYVWVDRYVHQLEVHFSGSIENIHIDRGLIRSNYRDFNKPVNISAPEDYEDMNSFYDYDMYNDMSDSRIIEGDARIKSAMTQARTHAEMYNIKNNNSYIGMENEDDIRALLMDAADRSNAFFPDVEVSEKEYCISIPLNDGGNFCVDSTGFAGRGLCYPYVCQ